MSYSYVKHRIDSSYPAIQVGVDNNAAIHRISNTTNSLKVQSERSSSTQWILFSVVVLCFIIAALIIRRQWNKSSRG